MKLLVYSSIMTVALMFSFSTAYAYYSTMDTGKIVPTGKYRAIIGPQFITTGGNDGTNLSGRFDAGVGESTTMRGLLGFGEDSMMYGGLFMKWIPYPDFENQPALGFIAGATYAREEYSDETEDVLSLRLAPLVSKEFDTDIGVLTPYASLPISVAFVDGTTIYPVQLTGGLEFKPYNWENVSFMGEVGLKLNKAFSYISLAVVFEFADDM